MRHAANSAVLLSVIHDDVFIALHDAATRLLWASHFSADYRQEAAIGKTISELVHKADRREAENAFGRCALLKEVQRFYVHSPPPKSQLYSASCYPLELPIAKFCIVSRIVPEQIANAELTPRERMVCRLYGEGKESKQIARLLGLEPPTVETHRANASRKVRAKGNAFIKWCVEHRALL